MCVPAQVKDQQQPAGSFYVGIPLTLAEYGVIKSLANVSSRIQSSSASHCF
jgi:hypothetical protein